MVKIDSAHGRFNSSITRVRPFFQQLFKRDSSFWISSLINLSDSSYAKTLSKNPGKILPSFLDKKIYKDKVLSQYGINEIELENCFEYRLPPPEPFLRWLIENSSELTWPAKETFGEKTRQKRLALIDGDTDVKDDALKELKSKGAEDSGQKWWAFEGFTEVDCLIETDTMFLAIEGKRTEEGPSKRISWYPARNQIIRNIEALKQIAKDKSYAVMLIDEIGDASLNADDFRSSLPHYKSEDIEEIMKHFLGIVTWRSACVGLEMDYNELPDTTEGAIKTIKGSEK